MLSNRKIIYYMLLFELYSLLFSYFSKNNNNYYPFLIFKEYDGNDIVEYPILTIILNYTVFDGYIYNNDIIRLKKNKICYSTTKNRDGNYIYIILVNLYENGKYTLRYFLMNLPNKYKISFQAYMKMHSFDGFPVIAFAYHFNADMCEGNNDYVCEALIIFSYPNSSDSVL